MKLSNIRIEDFKEEGKEKTRLICDVECGFSKERTVWFTVDKSFKEWLCTDVYDAFLMVMLYPAMYHSEDIEIEGAVSRKLLININHFIQAAKNAFDSECHIVNVKAKKYAIASKMKETHVGVGFGAGIDSFCSLEDHFFHPIDDENKVDTLCFILVDNYGDPLETETKKRAYNFYKNTKEVANELGINACFVDGTSMFKYHPVTPSRIRSEKEARRYINGFWARISCALALQKGLRRFIISSSSSYRDSLYYHNQMYSKGVLWFSEWCEGFMLPLVSPEGFDFISDGAQYPTRTEKVEKVINLPIVHKHLRACTGFFGTGEGVGDCGNCKKCKRMMLILDIMGKLDEWRDHFPVEDYKRSQLNHLCHVVQLAHYEDDLYAWDIIHLAEKHHYKMPSKCEADMYSFARKIYGISRIWKLKHLFRK